LDEIGLMVYEEMLFKVKVYGRTDAGQKSDHKSSPCHFVTGELIKGQSRDLSMQLGLVNLVVKVIFHMAKIS
jgi:hypothetical protein